MIATSETIHYYGAKTVRINYRVQGTQKPPGGGSGGSAPGPHSPTGGRRRPGGRPPPACAFILICEVEQKDISANLLFFVHLDAIKDGVGVREIGHVKVADLAKQS